MQLRARSAMENWTLFRRGPSFLPVFILQSTELLTEFRTISSALLALGNVTIFQRARRLVEAATFSRIICILGHFSCAHVSALDGTEFFEHPSRRWLPKFYDRPRPWRLGRVKKKKHQQLSQGRFRKKSCMARQLSTWSCTVETSCGVFHSDRNGLSPLC